MPDDIRKVQGIQYYKEFSKLATYKESTRKEGTIEIHAIK